MQGQPPSKKVDAMAKEKTPGPTKTYTEKVAEKIIIALENGTAPWIKPWKGGDLSGNMPINPISKNHYKGINLLNLLIEANINGYNDNRWLTYKQAKTLGAQVREGEKATTIQYWMWTEEVARLDEKGNVVLDENKKPIKDTVYLDPPKIFYSTVFNAAQIDGMPEIVREVSIDREFEAIEAAERILTNSGAIIHHREQGKAFYRPSSDEIILPLKKQFNDEMGYYSTALHELGHWTGHSSRLDRDISNPLNTFGSQGYAREELRAEIASYILCSELALDYDPGNHISYIGSWVAALKEKPSEIFKAAADAGKITQYLQKFNLDPSIDQTKDVNNIIDGDGAQVEVGEKVYFNVSYKEKKAAKELGAKWDKEAKLWYAQGSNVARMSEQFKPIKGIEEYVPFSIIFKRAEGPSAQCVEKNFNTFSEVNSYMLKMSHTAPKKDAGYDKCDFTVNFGNDDTYTGRYDLVHYSVEVPDLSRYIKEQLLFMSGELRPDHMTLSQYADCIASYGTLKQEAAEMLTRIMPMLEGDKFSENIKGCEFEMRFGIGTPEETNVVALGADIESFKQQMKEAGWEVEKADTIGEAQQINRIAAAAPIGANLLDALNAVKQTQKTLNLK